VSDFPEKTIRVPQLLWRKVIHELRRRGKGVRESGAFLLGRDIGKSPKVKGFVCYDDLDPDAYQGGGIQFHANGYAALWKLCREMKFEVLCDVHTHPRGVGQSGIDKRHPMIAVAGHTAMIVPNFADTTVWSLDGIGVYEYLGNFQWRVHRPDKPKRRVRLSWW
jgi:hypothetical protein